ncbi:MAG: 5-(carboxyamino)imidazole ribonucleotide mutase [Acidimicrobiales bacterium]
MTHSEPDSISQSSAPHTDGAPRVGIVMGSKSDLAIMRPASDMLTELDIAHELRVVSAHRTPDDMLVYGRDARRRGLQVLIAGAGGAAHLPGMLAAMTTLPVIGVPVPLRYLGGIDSLLSIVQMPSGVPVATVAIGSAGNAALLAARILAIGDPALTDALAALAATMAAASRDLDLGSPHGHGDQQSPAVERVPDCR